MPSLLFYVLSPDINSVLYFILIRGKDSHFVFKMGCVTPSYFLFLGHFVCHFVSFFTSCRSLAAVGVVAAWQWRQHGWWQSKVAMEAVAASWRWLQWQHGNGGGSAVVAAAAWRQGGGGGQRGSRAAVVARWRP